MKLSTRQVGQLLVFNLLGLIALCWPLWFYEFPFLYSDSGTYLGAANWGIIPIDRPIAYSDFIVTIANLIGVKALPLAQGVLILYVFYLAWDIVFPIGFRGAGGVMAILLAFVTGLAHHVNQLMPDLFTPLLFLIPVMLFLHWKTLGWQRWLLIAFLLLIAASHRTHMLLGMGSVLMMLGFFFRTLSKERWALIRALAIASAIVMVIPLNNLLHSGRWYFSDSSRVFFSASLHTAGVLLPWLDNHCGEENAPSFFCENKAELKELSGNDILWGSEILLDSSCLNAGGWGHCWAERNRDLAYLSSEWWKDREIRTAWMRYSLSAGIAQFSDFGLGMISSQKEGSAPFQVLSSEYPSSLEGYKASRQFQEDLYFPLWTNIQFYSVLGSALLLFFSCFVRNWSPIPLSHWRKLLTMLFLFLWANAWICGTLSNPLDRYQARIIWLVPALALAWLLHGLVNRKYDEKLDIVVFRNSSTASLRGDEQTN
ncbi:MAG: hypothetical protein LPK45_07425 [Bacteroidota bacterium]|nr:hypothetical protein [Bacteroidota bacterium]MDX5430904.1 hypothetical protein [Bacteroidota bacterium]MDX5469651.1 hypothetical protein [Bacteroidota bacterium]